MQHHLLALQKSPSIPCWFLTSIDHPLSWIIPQTLRNVNRANKIHTLCNLKLILGLKGRFSYQSHNTIFGLFCNFLFSSHDRYSYHQKSPVCKCHHLQKCLLPGLLVLWSGWHVTSCMLATILELLIRSRKLSSVMTGYEFSGHGNTSAKPEIKPYGG